MTTVTRPPIEVGIADKSPLVLAALKSLLGQTDRFSLTTVAASDGERFLETVKRLHFHVGIIGWVMPYHDGRAVLEVLRNVPGSPRIVVYTGDPDPGLPRRAMSLGPPHSSPSASRPSASWTRSRPWPAARWCSRFSMSAA
jgi:DNA-binding NarL/FixJ family response regulator